MFNGHEHEFGKQNPLDTAGIILSAEYDPDNQAAVGTFRFTANEAGADMLRLFQSLREEAPRAGIGLSLAGWIDNYTINETDRTITVNAFASIDSCDFVLFPAANGRVALDQEQIEEETMPQTTPTPAPTPATTPPPAPAPLLVPGETTKPVEFQQWAAVAHNTGVQAMLDAANLPSPTRNRLAAGTYPTPAHLTAAIDAARAELAAVADIIQTGPNPRGGQIALNNHLADYANAINWMLGDPTASLPTPHLRRLDLLYIDLTGDENFTMQPQIANIRLASANATTMVNMITDGLNKRVAGQWAHMHAYRWYEQIVSLQPNDGTLNDPKWIMFGGISTLPTVPYGQPYDELTVDDGKETAAFVVKGGYVGIDRKVLKNSEINKMRAIPIALVNAAIATRSAAIAALFTTASGTGPNLSDGNPWFHSSRTNVGSTALSATSWRATRILIYKHTEVNSGRRIALRPKFCLVPVDLWDTALIAFGYGEGIPTAYTPEAINRGPDDPRPIPIAVPEWTNTANWAAMVTPELWPTIGMTYSMDPGATTHPTPIIYTVTDPTAGLQFSHDTMPIKVFDEFATGPITGAGVYKHNV